MKNKAIFKVLAIVLNVLLVFSSVTSFAAARPPYEGVTSPNWKYLTMVAYAFAETDKDCVIEVGGQTNTPAGIYAYVYVSLQYFKDGKWQEYKHYSDQGHMFAVYDEYETVPRGYTYKLVITYKALDANGKVLETFGETSKNMITFL